MFFILPKFGFVWTDFSKKYTIPNFTEIRPVGTALIRVRTDVRDKANRRFSRLCEKRLKSHWYRLFSEHVNFRQESSFETCVILIYSPFAWGRPQSAAPQSPCQLHWDYKEPSTLPCMSQDRVSADRRDSSGMCESCLIAWVFERSLGVCILPL
jgi:hypothetical protein